MKSLLPVRRWIDINPAVSARRCEDDGIALIQRSQSLRRKAP